MTKQNKLKDMLIKRNPLLDTKREAVIPVDLYTKPQVDKTTSIQVVKATKPQVGKPTSLQTGKGTSPQVVKYTTHLKPETIKKLRRYAFDHDLKDYDVVEKAVGEHLERQEK